MSYIVLSDIHGCFDEMIQLLNKAGWYIAKSEIGDNFDYSYHFTLDGKCWTAYPPEGRLTESIVLLGDLGDRGPKSDLVLEFAMELNSQYKFGPYGKVVECVNGNHDDKLRRYLLGNPVKISHGLEKTIEQINKRGPEFKSRLLEFLSNLPYTFKSKEFIGVHAAFVECEKPKDEKQFALYGVVDKKAGVDEHGYPRRLLNWFDWYKGTIPVVFGHIVHKDVTEYDTVNSKAIAIDTGGVTGGKLSAIRFPGKEIFQIDCPAYHEIKDSTYEGPNYEKEEEIRDP